MRNITFIDGDITKTNCDCIVHQANCFKTMGSGVAKAITDLYPEVRKADNEFSFDCGKARAGKFSYVHTKHKYTGLPLVIGNLYGQVNYGREDILYTNYEYFKSALREFTKAVHTILGLPPASPVFIGIPYLIGCGLAHGDWNIMLSCIESIAVEHPEIEFIIVKYKGE